MSVEELFLDQGTHLYWVITVALLIVVWASLWKVFVKAGQPGWFAIIPMLNALVLLRVAGLSLLWLLVPLFPYVGLIIFWIFVSIGLAKAFGRSGHFAVGLVFLPFVFLPILAFGSATYLGGTKRKEAKHFWREGLVAAREELRRAHADHRVSPVAKLARRHRTPSRAPGGPAPSAGTQRCGHDHPPSRSAREGRCHGERGRRVPPGRQDG